MSEEDYVSAEVADRLLDEIVALKDRLKQAEAKNQWQPIETAPTGFDAPYVLVWGGGAVRICAAVYADEWCDESGAAIDPVTHWMPLPDEPHE